jgi:hypothetical protein
MLLDEDIEFCMRGSKKWSVSGSASLFLDTERRGGYWETIPLRVWYYRTKTYLRD